MSGNFALAGLSVGSQTGWCVTGLRVDAAGDGAVEAKIGS
jgi:hypothetical protein